MSNMEPELSLAIPFYNEEECAKQVTEQLVSTFKTKKVDYELILINNGSTDRTPQILREMAEKNKNLKLVDISVNQDYGGGIMEGLKKANGRYVGFTCGDGEVSAEDTYKVYKTIKKKNIDICKTIRVSRKDGVIRTTYSKIFNKTVGLLFNLKTEDVNGYPMIMKTEVYTKIEPQIKNWIFNLDILHRAKKNNFTMKEIPVRHRPRLRGESKDFSPRKIVKISKMTGMFGEVIAYRLKN